jgi:hypothetical protein
MEEPKPITLFTPVPLRHRNDGWTVEKRYAFIQALTEQPRARTRMGSLRLLRFAAPSLRTFAKIRRRTRGGQGTTLATSSWSSRAEARAAAAWDAAVAQRWLPSNRLRQPADDQRRCVDRRHEFSS